MDIEELKKDPKKLESVAKKAFDDFDKNKNGKLEFNEIYKVLEGFSASTSLLTPSAKEVRETFNSLDLNKDGKINFNEFLELFKQYIKSYKK